MTRNKNELTEDEKLEAEEFGEWDRNEYADDIMTKDEEKESMEYDRWVDSPEEIRATRNFTIKDYFPGPDAYINGGIKGIQEIEYEKMKENGNDLSVPDDGTDKTKYGKVFGFIKGKFEEATAGFQEKRKIKEEARKEYLRQRPLQWKKQYEDYYQMKLQKSRKPPMTSDEKNKWLDEKFRRFSTGMKRVAWMFGGAQSPDRVMGFGGSVFGPWRTDVAKLGIGVPKGRKPILTYDPMYEGLAESSMAREQVMRTPRAGMPGEPTEVPPGYSPPPRYESKLSEPGVPGSQVPKYKAYPKGAQPGSEWTRVTKIDKYGKKRSYIRKVTVPGTGTVVPGPRSPTAPQQMPPESQEQAARRVFGSTGLRTDTTEDRIVLTPDKLRSLGIGQEKISSVAGQESPRGVFADKVNMLFPQKEKRKVSLGEYLK